MRKIISLAGLLLLAGCASTPYVFMGVPEDQVQTIDQKNPQIDYRLRGIPVMTKVESVDYRRYEDLKRKGRITKEERRGDVVYFAISDSLHVPLGSAGPGTADGAYLNVTERYRAVIPK